MRYIYFCEWAYNCSQIFCSNDFHLHWNSRFEYIFRKFRKFAISKRSGKYSNNLRSLHLIDMTWHNLFTIVYVCLIPTWWRINKFQEEFFGSLFNRWINKSNVHRRATPFLELPDNPPVSTRNSAMIIHLQTFQKKKKKSYDNKYNWKIIEKKKNPICLQTYKNLICLTLCNYRFRI